MMAKRNVKALSVKEPWASMLVSGFKTAEIRSKPTKHRGELLVVASRTPDFSALRLWMVYADRIPIYRLGLAIGFVWVEDCVPFTEDLEGQARLPYRRQGATFNEWAWILDPKKAHFVEPFEVKGRLGIFDVEYTEVTNIQ